MKMFVSYLQNAKSQMTNRIIKDEQLNDAAQNYIKAQTDFANMLLDNTECMMKYTFDMMNKGAKKNEQ